VPEDEDRGAAILVSRQLYIDRALVAPQLRARKTRPDERLAKFWLQACPASSAITHVIERLLAPCAGIGSIGSVEPQAATAALIM
jgi:hypothetical protein